jgi:hypothetical protein
MAPLILAALVSGILAACATTDQTVKLPATEASVGAMVGSGGGSSRVPGFAGAGPPPAMVGAGRVIIILPIVDKRTPADHVGIKKNAFCVAVAKTYPDRHVGTWLRQRLRAELRAAGFNVVPVEAAGPALTIQLVLQKFFTEPVFHWPSVDLESDLAVQMSLTDSHGVAVERSYDAKGLARGEGPPESNYTRAMEQATEYIMHRMVPDIVTAVRMPDLSEKRDR